MFKATGLRSWNLNADDLEAMARFYREVLGCEESGRQDVGGVEVARLKVGGQSLGLFDAKEGPRPYVPHHTFVCEGPADAGELVAELKAGGTAVENVRVHGNGNGYSLYVTDPAGNQLELSVQH